MKFKPIHITINDAEKHLEVGRVIENPDILDDILSTRRSFFGEKEIPSYIERRQKQIKKPTKKEYSMDSIKSAKAIYDISKTICKKYYLPHEFINVIAAAIISGKITEKDYIKPVIRHTSKIKLQRILYCLNKQGHSYKILAKSHPKIPLETIISSIKSYKSKLKV